VFRCTGPRSATRTRSPLAGGDLGEGSRIAAGTGAWLCFEDEAGQNLRPPKARTWARRGRTPVVTVSGKGSGRVSVAGMACIRPGARGRRRSKIIEVGEWRKRLRAALPRRGGIPVDRVYDSAGVDPKAIER
jgi:hypothetical protein